MAKYNMYKKHLSPKPSKIPVHPIWRGIGCVLIIVIPFFSYMIASYLINNRANLAWIILPEDLILDKLKDAYLAIKILYASFITLILGFLLALFTYFSNRLMAPPRLGPYDVSLDDITKVNR